MERSTIRTIAIGSTLALVVLWVLFRTTVLGSYSNEGPSMEPTLLSGDRFLLSRLSYGLYPSFTDEALVTWASPEPGDLIVAVSPADGYEIVKRVIGVGGDTITTREGIIYRNDEPLGAEVVGPCAAEAQLHVDETCQLYRERVGGTEYVVSYSRHFFVADLEPVVVPEGHVYVLGDHRDASNDSRNALIGPIPVSLVRGLAIH